MVMRTPCFTVPATFGQYTRTRTVKYKPDITILNLFWGNDIDDNIDRLRNGNYNPLKDEYPEFSLWNRVLVTRKNFNKWLWNRFITYQFIRQRYNILEQKVKGWLRRDRKEYKKRIKEFRTTGVDSESGKIPQGVKPGAMTVDTDSIFDDRFFADSEGMKLTRKLILKLNQEVRAPGGRLAVIHFPKYDQIHDYPAMPLEEFDEFLAVNEIPHLNLFPKQRHAQRHSGKSAHDPGRLRGCLQTRPHRQHQQQNKNRICRNHFQHTGQSKSHPPGEPLPAPAAQPDQTKPQEQKIGFGQAHLSSLQAIERRQKGRAKSAPGNQLDHPLHLIGPSKY